MSNHHVITHKVYLEVTNYCNFRCDFCPSRALERKRQHMDWALFQKCVDDIAGDGLANTVGFHVMGEPLLYPKIYDALRHAKSKGLRTELNTNGSLLTTERVGQLVEAGLDELSISAQITDEREHACRGTDLRFDVYYRRLLDAVRQIRESGSNMQVVLCSMDTSTRRYFDIDRPMRVNGRGGDYRRKLARLILDTCSAINAPTSAQEVSAALGRMNLIQPTFIRIDERIAVYAQPFMDWGNAFTSRRIYLARIGACGYALTNVGVLSNGQVTVCCGDYEGRTSLGNLRTQSLASILASEPAQAIRDGFARMRVVHPYCQRCIGSANPLKVMFKGLASIYLFRWLQFQPARVKEVALATV